MTNESLESLENSALLYGALSSLLVEDMPEAIQLLKHLVEKLENGDPFPVENLIELTLSFVDDLSDLGYIEEYSEEAMVEFDIKTIADEDPKKKLN